MAHYTAAGSSVGTAAATPYETGDTLAYVVLESNDGLFAINACTGVLSTAVALSGTAGNSHALTVEATDPHGQKARAMVTIMLE